MTRKCNQNQMNRWRKILGGCLLLLLGLVAARAAAAPFETIVWSDNFDTNAASRWSATGGWHISIPTAGPPTNSAGHRAYSGSLCANTQNYKINTDSRLACTSYNGSNYLTIPSADQAPRLRFWHWFNLSSSLGFVEISTDGVNWNQISPTYQNSPTSGGVWSRPSIDLTPYAGQNVQFRFRFYGAAANNLGWFVDDVEVVSGVPWLNFPEGFEAGQGNWSVEQGTWQIGIPTSGPGKAHAGTNCAATVLAGNYPASTDTRLLSPYFVVPTNGSPALRFWHWYSFGSAALGFVELNNGITTTIITSNTVISSNVTVTLNTNVYQFYGAADTDYSTALYWNTNLGGWTNSAVVMGCVNDRFNNDFAFEAGPPPLTNLGVAIANYIVSEVSPQPASLHPTNFLALHGATWLSQQDDTDTPLGYFATNTTVTITTNTAVTTNSQNWVQISPTFRGSSGGWQQVSVDLSNFLGQAVQLSFHFASAGTPVDPGWYVDDLALAVAPMLFVPTNTTLNVGAVYTNQLVATNVYSPNAIYAYRIVSAPRWTSVSSNGLLTVSLYDSLPTSTNTITVAVSDNSLPPLSATNSFVLTVLNTNLPALIMPPPETNYAGQTVEASIVATNVYNPGASLELSLVPPFAPTVDASDLSPDGSFTWQTLASQKAGTYTNFVSATDQASNLSVTNSFEIVLLPAPGPALLLPAVPPLFAGQTFEVQVLATNSVFPDSTFAFGLANPPGGASIDSATGELIWPTTPTNKSQTVSFTVIVTDNNSLSATGKLSVTVSPTPRPTLILPVSATNFAGRQISIPVSATNSVLTNAVYNFRLLSASTNMMMTSNSITTATLTWTNTGVRNGVLIWTNSSVAPATNTVYVVVKDNSAWANSTTNPLALIFRPPLPPSLLPPTNETIFAGQTLTDLLAAINPVLPNAQYTLTLAGSFTNGTLKTNLFTWTNAVASPGIYRAAIKISDNSNSVPALLATNTLSVTVLPSHPQLSLSNLVSPASGAVQFSLATPWTNTAWRIEAATNLAAAPADWLPVHTNLGDPGGLLFTDLLATNFPQRYYRAVFP